MKYQAWREAFIFKECGKCGQFRQWNGNIKGWRSCRPT